MDNIANNLKQLLSAGAEPLALAAIGLVLLWLVVRLRGMSEFWRGTFRIPQRLVRRRRAPQDIETSPVRLAAAKIIGWGFVLAASAYLSLRIIPEAFQYAELKRNISRGQQLVHFAIWRDPILRCKNGEPLGIHLRRLFEQPQIFLLDLRWDEIPPRYEVVITGQTQLMEGSLKRALQISISVGLDGQAELRGGELLGENNAVEAVRRLLAAACSRTLNIGTRSPVAGEGPR